MPAPKADPAKHVYDALVTRVKDGDTISAAIRLRPTTAKDRDLGFHVYFEFGYIALHEDIRLFGINANEHGTAAGDEATKFLKSLIAPGAVIRVATKVVKDKDSKEKYGRWLGTLWRPGDDTSLNDQLVAAGHAKSWDGQGARPI